MMKGYVDGHPINLGRKQTPEHIANSAAVRRGRKQTPEQIVKSLATRRANDPEGLRYAKAAITLKAHKEAGLFIPHICWCKGKKREPGFGAIIKKKAIERHITFKKRDEIVQMYLEPGMSASTIAKKYNTNKQVITRRLRECGVKLKTQSELLSGIPKTEEHIRKCLRRRIPTCLESDFQKIIDKNGLPYKFVGDGSFMIGRKNPDFININGEKIAIEVYAPFYKTINGRNIEEWRKDRSRVFMEYGWDLLFFETSQVNENHVLSVLVNKT